MKILKRIAAVGAIVGAIATVGVQPASASYCHATLLISGQSAAANSIASQSMFFGAGNTVSTQFNNDFAGGSTSSANRLVRFGSWLGGNTQQTGMFNPTATSVTGIRGWYIQMWDC